MNDPPRVSEQINTLIELVKQNMKMQNEIINRLKEIKKPKENKYKYQELIDYLKEKGKNEEVSSSHQICIDKEQVLDLLQETVKTENKKKCLTEEEFQKYLYLCYLINQILNYIDVPKNHHFLLPNPISHSALKRT